MYAKITTHVIFQKLGHCYLNNLCKFYQDITEIKEMTAKIHWCNIYEKDNMYFPKNAKS